MIYAALTAVTDKINMYFSNRFSFNEEKVVLSNIVTQDGSIAIQETDKIIVTLVNLEKEKINLAAGKSSNSYSNRPINLNIFILFSAYFSEQNYPEALKFLSAVVAFFQSNPVLTHENTPELDERIHKLSLEIENVDMQTLSHLWGVLGGKHLPSVFYKIRMVTFDDDTIDGTFSSLTGTGSNVN